MSDKNKLDDTDNWKSHTHISKIYNTNVVEILSLRKLSSFFFLIKSKYFPKQK